MASEFKPKLPLGFIPKPGSHKIHLLDSWLLNINPKLPFVFIPEPGSHEARFLDSGLLN
jgi:hypothetical protein